MLVCLWTDLVEVYTDEEWEGRERIEERCEVGLLLDLDEGTLTVYKDERRLGVMKGGLGGEYCFCATLYGVDDSYVLNGPGESVSIKRGSKCIEQK